MNKSACSKLFKLKEWLTLPEAAKHLSVICGEEIIEADILRLALDRQVTLSVNFVHPAHAKLGKVVYFDEEELRNSIKQGIYPTDFEFADMPFSNDKLMLAMHIGDGKFLKIGDKIVTIDGVWDLPMIGGEGIYVESKYQELTGGPEVDLINIDGTFVARNDVICGIQESADDYHGYGAQWQVQMDKLRRLELNNTKNPRKEKILPLRKEKQHKAFKILDEWNRSGRYYSAGNLPDHIVLVIRTEALRELEQRLSETEPEMNTLASNDLDKQGLSETTRRTLLKLVLGMAIDAYGYDPTNSRNSATGDKNGISVKLQARGFNIDTDTIRKYLTEAKELQ